ncbi:hypothetical protein BC962_0293 [Gillisia mitskevichiae]|uniref:Uncharacterized protein n=2 Tax=Gillisia mitskevichiae TaxID=270921 RepID=A0A495PYB0_9FLAO|nr:hypothetical protein BC962_0293 [Gillisia mitskevichiae]
MRMHYIDSWSFIIFMIFYSLIYRTYIDGLRLVSKGVIDKADIWKMFYNGRRFQNFKELYFK